MKKVKRYSVCLIFNEDGTKVLLQLKKKTTFAGMLNGVGGKAEDNETMFECAFREIEEETNVRAKDFSKFEWIATLTVPEQCDTENKDCMPELGFFAGTIKNEDIARKPSDDAEDIMWFDIINGKVDTKDYIMGGDGDLQYMIDRSLRILFDSDK